MILAIVSHGEAEKVISVALSAGASGATILRGRAACAQKRRFFHFHTEIREDILLIMTDKKTIEGMAEKIDVILQKGTDYTGMMYIIPMDEIVGTRK